MDLSFATGPIRPLTRGNINPIGQGPFILNVGAEEDADRGLAVYVPAGSDGPTIQFLADVSSIAANAFQLEFDIEAWDKVGSPPESEARRGGVSSRCGVGLW